MKYVLIGMLLNSLVTSGHDTRESCEGRLHLLREKGVIGKCVDAPNSNVFTISPNIQYYGQENK